METIDRVVDQSAAIRPLEAVEIDAVSGALGPLAIVAVLAASAAVGVVAGVLTAPDKSGGVTWGQIIDIAQGRPPA